MLVWEWEISTCAFPPSPKFCDKVDGMGLELVFGFQACGVKVLSFRGEVSSCFEHQKVMVGCSERECMSCKFWSCQRKEKRIPFSSKIVVLERKHQRKMLSALYLQKSKDLVSSYWKHPVFCRQHDSYDGVVPGTWRWQVMHNYSWKIQHKRHNRIWKSPKKLHKFSTDFEF